jgi:protease-4
MKPLNVILLLMACASSVSAGERFPMPVGAFYYQPAGTVFGGEAIWINPAGLGRYDADGLQVMGDYRNGRAVKTWGALVHRKGVGIAYRQIEQPSDATIREWIFAAGVKTSADFEWGGSLRWFSAGSSVYNGRKLWNIGLLRRPGGPISWGIVVGNINRSKLNGEFTDTELRYSLGYRPMGNKLTLAADMLLSTRTRFKNAEFVYHAEFTPIPGLYINGLVDSHRNFQVGARVNLLRDFVGAKSGLDRSCHHRGTTVFAGVTTMHQTSVMSEPAQRLVIPLSQFGGENPAKPIFGRSSRAFAELILSLYRASTDPRVAEVMVIADRFSLSFAQAQEVRQALRQVKSAGRKVVWYDASPGNLSYYVGSIADQIIIPPVSQLNLVGLRAELTFYGGTLEKLGIKADLLRIGEYKTAAEMYAQSAASEENRQQVNRLLDNYFGQLTNGIAEGRRISPDSVKILIDHGPFTSVQAKTLGLVDLLAYQDELDTCLSRAVRPISYARYVRDTLVTDEWQSPPVVAVVVAEGEIVGRNDPGSPLDNDPRVSIGVLERAFEQVRRDRSVKGIVLRINSPGGDALASDAIHRAFTVAARARPTVVSMAGVAASGGYYIATPSSHLYASPATVTGSIGIFGGKLDLGGMYKKIALGKELYTRGHYSGMLTSTRPFTDDERQKYMEQLRAFYDHFVELAATRSSLSADSVDHLGRGRVWSGEEAKANGLVDELGGLWESLKYLQKQTGLTRYRIKLYPQRRPLFVWPSKNLLSMAVKFIAGGREDLPAVPSLADLSPDGLILARLPYDLDIR